MLIDTFMTNSYVHAFAKKLPLNLKMTDLTPAAKTDKEIINKISV